MKYLVCLSCLAAGFPLLAQTTFQEQAARLQNINAFLQDFRPGTAPERVGKSRLELAFELYPQPDLDTRVGRKDEPIDPPSVVPRVRARYLLKNGLFLGGSAVPGIEFQDYDADTVAAEAGWRFKFGDTTLQLRASYSDGDITGPITETDAMDDFTFTNYSYDLAAARTFGAFHVFGFVGSIDTDTELDIESDGVHLENTESTWYAGLGVTWDWRALAFTLEQDFTDDYLANVIVSAAYRF
ncbi:MAG: hypothetical protein QNK37_37575 [Acidobacteriota bacterium]|nr:hypothetical protein [Acidobacteriota bacterium]